MRGSRPSYDGRFSTLLGVGVRPTAAPVPAAGPSAIEFDDDESDGEEVVDHDIYKNDDEEEPHYDDILLYDPDSDVDDDDGESEIEIIEID